MEGWSLGSKQPLFLALGRFIALLWLVYILLDAIESFPIREGSG